MGARFEHAQAEEIRDAFARHGVRYLLSRQVRRDTPRISGYDAGRAPFVEKSEANGAAIVVALRELGFVLSDARAGEVGRGKDFVQLKDGPFDLDLVFALDGIESFAEAWSRRVEVEGFPVCHLDDIIRSRMATNRAKDRESLPRLRSFREYWMRRRDASS